MKYNQGNLLLLDEQSFQLDMKIDFILFDYVIEHLARIIQIVKTPRGNALLIGIGCSGKYY
jgi:dynein heavy chain